MSFFYQKRAELSEPGERKKRTIPIVLPSGGAAAARRRHRAKQHRGYIGREKSLYYAFRLISGRPRLGTRPGGPGETQAVTTSIPDGP